MTQPSKTLSARATYEMLKTGRPPRRPGSLPYRLLAKTCPKCGTLNTTPDELIRSDSRTRTPRCRVCDVRRAVDYSTNRKQNDQEYSRRRSAGKMQRQRRSQAATLGAAGEPRNHRKLWTGPELETAARHDLSAAQVAAMLGRSLYAVKTIRHRLLVEPDLARVAGLVTDQ